MKQIEYAFQFGFRKARPSIGNCDHQFSFLGPGGHFHWCSCGGMGRRVEQEIVYSLLQKDKVTTDHWEFFRNVHLHTPAFELAIQILEGAGFSAMTDMDQAVERAVNHAKGAGN